MGCVVSTIIACLLCNNRCSVERLASKMAFHPPNPPSYTIDTLPDGTSVVKFLHVERSQARDLLSRSPVQVDVRVLVTHRKQTIPVFHFQFPGAKTTILWSHANAMDCGEMYFFFVQFAERLRVNVAAYDYSGYGAATGVPTERNIYADARATYEFVCNCNANVADWNLILYGQSIGSVPTLWLATHYSVSGVILHAPLLSGLRFLIPPPDGVCSAGGCCSPVCVYALCDPFPNIKRITKVTSPVLLIHGTHDKTVDYSHSLQLHARCPEPYKRDPFLIKGAGHENVVDSNPEMYFREVRNFLVSLRESSQTGGSQRPCSDTRAMSPAVGGGSSLDYERICTSYKAASPASSKGGHRSPGWAHSGATPCAPSMARS
ncbi:hypothetical protein AB1Y20_003802 [Prymnesium parvum]|uniref:Serine aminopeptidase S33 domain-containing protein n=1 Tax=Prymnesium parvum TaxID=97485 RepID=A0AB34J7L6_PRYPA|mmetsp:Transcript_4297/g.10690  ORF Transcript_4297/g.10690 Transcript_4297/m.10690 type:complete len:376 (+) Transcript_4297:316-1443(+)